MKKQLLLLLIICAGIQMTAAQKNADAEQESRRAIQKEIAEIKKEQQNPINSLLSVADVGEPDSFGKNVKFLGTASTGVVFVYRSCDPAILLAELELVLGADDRCLAQPFGAGTVSATFTDLGRITIPGRSVDNVVYFVLNNTAGSETQNTFANGIPVFSSYIPRITIESAALNDPAALDPNTGQPLNGVLTVSAFGTKIFNKTVPANDFEFFYDSYSSAATRGFARSYFADLGLPQTVINNLYRQPMTIRLGMRVATRNVSFGQYFYAMRLTGN
jgi:hypothetical protein